jgi:hypothetical protein
VRLWKPIKEGSRAIVATENVEWKSEYEVGNFEIDFEHQIFVRIIQKIQQTIEEGSESIRLKQPYEQRRY